MHSIGQMIRGEIEQIWSEASAAGGAIARELEEAKGTAEQRLQDWLTSPEVLRALFSFLRATKPIWVRGSTVIVTRYDDVLAVLDRPDVFSIVPINAARMERTSGAFILGMDDTPVYRREAGILRKAWRTGDLAAIGAFTERAAGALIDAARPAGRIDAASGLSHLVPARVVASFFGVPGPDEATLMRWMRTIFHEIFLNPTNTDAVSAAADLSSSEMKPYLSSLIVERRAELAAGRANRDDFLTRLVAMQADPETRLDDDGIRRNIGGVIVGAVDTVSRVIAQALDQLLDRPEQLAAAAVAAARGDDALVSAHTFEALRFNPQNPLLLRSPACETKLAAGTDRETIIPAGATVYAVTLSAMFDDAHVDAPREYRPGRPAGDYLHFGHGMHTCFGQHVARAEAPLVMKSLLRLPGLRRAQGDAGHIRYEGPFPENLIVEFDAS